jgi:hypothetical protein
MNGLKPFQKVCVFNSLKSLRKAKLPGKKRFLKIKIFLEYYYKQLFQMLSRKCDLIVLLRLGAEEIL